MGMHEAIKRNVFGIWVGLRPLEAPAQFHMLESSFPEQHYASIFETVYKLFGFKVNMTMLDKIFKNST